MEINMTEVRNLSEKRKWLKQFLIAYHGYDIEEYDVVPHEKYFETFVNGERAGFIMLKDETYKFERFTSNEVWNLDLMFVKEKFRHMGICEGMIRWAIKNHQVEMIDITVGRLKKNSDFYYRLGFRTWEPVDIDDMGFAYQGRFGFVNAQKHLAMGICSFERKVHTIKPKHHLLLAA